MSNKRVLVIDEESAFTRFLQDDLEQREISVACVYSPGDENGATAFAPNVIVADKEMLSHNSSGLLSGFDPVERKLPLVLMTGTDTKLFHGSAPPLRTGNSQIVATIAKPFEPEGRSGLGIYPGADRQRQAARQSGGRVSVETRLGGRTGRRL